MNDWEDTQEGPFETREAARLFAYAEVGLPHRIRRTPAGWIIETREPSPDNDQQQGPTQ